MRREAPLIVGGGPAGATAALLLARAGARPVLLERQRATGDALCGGFLSWRTLAALDALGIDRATLNPDPIGRVRMIAGKQSAEAPLPAPAFGVSRHRLDTVLLDAAEAAGAAIERGVGVRAIDAGRCRLADGATLSPAALFLATGKRELRGRPRGVRPARDPALGLRVRIAPSPALVRRLRGTIELLCFRNGYAGALLQEDDSVNLCMAVRRSRLEDAGSPALLLRSLGEEVPLLGDLVAEMAADAPIDAVANIPYGWVAPATEPGTFRLGDQAAVIPSLAGEGIGIALASAQAAVSAWHGGGKAEEFQRGFARVVAAPVRRAGLLYRLAEHHLPATMMVRTIAAAPALAEIAARLTRVDHLAIDAVRPAPHI